MTYAIVLTFTLLAVALAAALVREHRLRRALETLLRKILTAWRNQHIDTHTSRDRDHPSDNAAPDDQLQ